MQPTKQIKLVSSKMLSRTITFDPDLDEQVRIDTNACYMKFEDIDAAIEQLTEFLDGAKTIKKQLIDHSL